MEIEIITTCHCDALGDTIKIGQRYGWSSNHNGFTKVILGKAEKLSKNGVCIKVDYAVQSLYTHNAEYIQVKEKINVRGINLFPLSENNSEEGETSWLSWIKESKTN